MQFLEDDLLNGIDGPYNLFVIIFLKGSKYNINQINLQLYPPSSECGPNMMNLGTKGSMVTETDLITKT
jgi:hypothetical protein